MGQLQLDKPTHTTYYGKNVEQMPQLLADGNEPMSVAHLMEQRLAVRRKGVSPVQHDAWWDNYFDTADLWLRHPDKGGKVVPYNAAVFTFLQKHLKPETKLVDYALSLPDGFFEAMDGLELKIADIKLLHSRGYTSREAKKSYVWRTLARTQKRLDNYVNAVVAETGRTRDLMRTYFGKSSPVPIGRLWSVDNWDDGSNAYSDGDFQNDHGRLVGVTRKAHVARAKNNS